MQNSSEKREERLFHSKHNSSISHFSLVPQTYRYCFMCEEPILETNLLAHEAQCAQLQAAYLHDLPKIVELLDAKIDRLSKEVERSLLSRGDQQIGQEFQTIKQSVKTWMQQLPPQALTQRPREQSQQRERGQWREGFARIEEHIGSSVCRSFSALSKLNWFAKLRENIGDRYFA